MGSSSTPGMEFQLADTPGDWSYMDLKRNLKDPLEAVYRKPLDFDILVILRKSSRDIRWDKWNSDQNPLNSARLVIPSEELGAALERERTIKVPNSQASYTFNLTRIKNPATDDARYEELRNRKEYVIQEPSGALASGDLGDISLIECGDFDGGNNFVAFASWTPEPNSGFNKLSWYSDIWPKKFQACISGKGPVGKSPKWAGEWMDMSAPNIMGIVFSREKPQETTLKINETKEAETKKVETKKVETKGVYSELKGLKTESVYFILKKPPQFYKRTQSENTTPIDSRISYPSIQGYAKVVDVPWPIQYCRVYRVKISTPKILAEEKFHNEFNFDKGLYSISSRYIESHPGDKNQKEQALNEVAARLKSYGLSSRLGFEKLLLNGHILSDQLNEVISTIQIQFENKAGVDDDPILCRFLDRSATEMETCHLRALKRLAKEYVQAEVDPQSPCYPMFLVTEPVAAIKKLAADQNLMKQLKAMNSLARIFQTLIYPSHVELQGPENTPKNSIMEEYETDHNRFLSVRFLENNGSPYRTETGIETGEIIETRVTNILKKPLQLNEQDFEFLAYSTSGLTNRNLVWFLETSKSPTAKEVRDWIGDWTADDSDTKKLIRNPSKWGARMGQAFSYSEYVLNLKDDEWMVQDDVFCPGRGQSRLPYSDGCGFISKHMCEEINDNLKSLNPSNYIEFQAFQIRFGGAKGVVYAAPDYLFQSLASTEKQKMKTVLRKSLIKFKVPAKRNLEEGISFRVVSAAKEYLPPMFNKPLLKALEDIGADPVAIETIYNNSLAQSAALNADSFKNLGATSSTSNESASHGTTPNKNQESLLSKSFVMLRWKRYIDDAFKIPIPNAYTALGLTDDCQVLKDKEIYLRTTESTISGQVLIYRNPIIHIGDIQEAYAVSDAELRQRIEESSIPAASRAEVLESLQSMHNVVFFSQKGARPLPNMLSGGDLDGDKYHILTKDITFWGNNLRTREPASYELDDSAPTETSDCNMGALADFVGRFIRYDCVGRLSTALLVVAEAQKDGLNSETCKILAQHISQAVDFQKNGVQVDYNKVTSDLKVEINARPDYVRAIDAKDYYNPDGKYYRSSGLLGKIWRILREINTNLGRLRLDNAEDLRANVEEYFKTKFNDDPGLSDIIPHPDDM